MGYTVELHDSYLWCRSEADAEAAAEVIDRHTEMCPYHLEVSSHCMSNPPRDDAWVLEVDHFAGDHWNDEKAVKLWLALAPHLADGATIEFRGEEGERWRIRWKEGRVIEEYVKDVIWAVVRELQPPQKGSTL